MNYDLITRDKELKIIGVSQRIIDPGNASSIIRDLWNTYDRLNSAIPSISNKVYAIYTDYDPHGHYTVIIGREVSHLSMVPQNMIACSIALGTYAHYKVQGPIPSIIIDFWSNIWSSPLDYNRAFTTDYEVYIPSLSYADIYISVTSCM